MSPKCRKQWPRDFRRYRHGKAEPDTDEEQTYRIVGDDEADLPKSHFGNPPIARGLTGKEQDDVVVIKRPAAMWNTKCFKVEYL